MGIIKAFKLGFDYLKYDEDGNVQDTQRAVNDVNLDIEAGQFVAVLGHNGSGKSDHRNCSRRRRRIRTGEYGCAHRENLGACR